MIYAEFFGLLNLPKAMGLAMTAWVWGGVLGNPFAGWLYDISSGVPLELLAPPSVSENRRSWSHVTSRVSSCESRYGPHDASR